MDVIKNYFLDTNILLSSPYSIFSFDEHNVIICASVLEELDKAKTLPGEKGFNARETIRLIESLRSVSDLKDGVLLKSGGMLYIHFDNTDNNLLPKSFNHSYADNKLLNEILNIDTEAPHLSNNKILVTNDLCLRLKAESLSIKSEEYKTDRVKATSEQYKGRGEIYVSDEDIHEFYNRKKITLTKEKREAYEKQEELVINKFFLLRSETSPTTAALGRYDGKDIVPLNYLTYLPYGIIPKNIGQKFVIEALLTPAEEAPLVIIKGPAGTAKTFLSLACGLELVLNKNPQERAYEKVLVCRPNVKFDEDIGYLPGDENEKISGLIRPIYDNLKQLCKSKNEKDGSKSVNYIDYLFDSGLFEAQAMAFMRGRSIANSYIILDEAQNMSSGQAFGIISRAGQGTKIILIGDTEQIDNPALDSRTNGLSFASERMKGSKLAWQITFTEEECVRSNLAIEAIEKLSPKGFSKATNNEI